MRKARFLSLALLLAAGCRTRLYGALDLAPSPDGALDLAAPDLTVVDFASPPDLVPPPDLTLPFICRDIYVVDANTKLLSGFDARLGQFFDVGTINCPGTMGSPETMSVARDGTAWLFFTDHQLFHVDIRTAACTATGFVPAQLAADPEFGSSFSADTPGGATDTLFLGLPENGGTLASVDQTTLRLDRIAPLSLGSVELTGTRAAELWAFAPTATGSSIWRVDKTTGAVDHEIPIPELQSANSGFAFAFWGGSFWIFLFDYNSPTIGDTGVYRVDATTGAFDTVLAHTGRHVVGAGVAACAPLGLDQ